MNPSGDKHSKYANSLAGMYTKEIFLFNSYIFSKLDQILRQL